MSILGWRCRHALLALGLGMSSAQAQEAVAGLARLDLPDAAEAGVAAEAPARRSHGRPQREDGREWPGEVRKRTLGIVAASSLGVAVYGQRNWWNDGFRSRFRSVDEGWFGQHTYSGGADKLGHFYMNYAAVRLFARAFEWAGNGPDASPYLAAWLSLGTFTAIEVLDGFSKQWRFSKEDVVMNVAGIGAALLMERNPELDRVLDLRFHYLPSRREGQGFDPFGDYSGQTYVAVVKASGIPALSSHPVLRYAELALGYGTRDYNGGHGTRNVYVGVSLNLGELLNKTVFRGARQGRRTQRIAETTLEFIQVPGTALFARHRLDAAPAASLEDLPPPPAAHTGR